MSKKQRIKSLTMSQKLTARHYYRKAHHCRWGQSRRCSRIISRTARRQCKRIEWCTILCRRSDHFSSISILLRFKKLLCQSPLYRRFHYGQVLRSKWFAKSSQIHFLTGERNGKKKFIFFLAHLK
jgi:hypothetical protein